ncbi:hypothetical protein C349_03775 [Cryptococcus neoformans var. grubii Br795]|nr:hypothetical protein C368_03843 [Cryptococcus neoformans var. grubii 125.91]OXG81233.1 hypothetical protein C349_03775 [Cryptococcus neoformans var. grubii Br795]
MNGTQKILGASFIDKKRMRKKEECGRHWATGVQKARQKKWGGRGPRNHQPKEGKGERLAPGIKRRWTSRRRVNSRRFRSEESSFTMNINMGLNNNACFSIASRDGARLERAIHPEADWGLWNPPADAVGMIWTRYSP